MRVLRLALFLCLLSVSASAQFFTPFIPFSATTCPAAPDTGSLSWYKSENIQQAAGFVTSWTDAGSLARNLSVSGSPAPAYVSSAVNGFAGAQLTAANSDQFSNVVGGWSDWVPAANFNIYAVFRYDATPTAPAGLTGASASNNPSMSMASSTTAEGVGADGSNKTTGTVPVALSTFYVWQLHYNGSNLGLRVNGTESSTVAFGSYVATGAVFRVGQNNGSFVSATAVELITYGSQTGGGQSTTLSYLGCKFGLTP